MVMSEPQPMSKDKQLKEQWSKIESRYKKAVKLETPRQLSQRMERATATNHLTTTTDTD